MTVFGMQPSLSMLELRLCFDDLGIAGFGVGVLCRNAHPGSRLHIHLSHHTSSLHAVQVLNLIAAAMCRTPLALRAAHRWPASLPRRVGRAPLA